MPQRGLDFPVPSPACMYLLVRIRRKIWIMNRWTIVSVFCATPFIKNIHTAPGLEKINEQRNKQFFSCFKARDK